jgi:hypothetical protein
VIPVLIDIHGYIPGPNAPQVTEAVKAFLAKLQAEHGLEFPTGELTPLATVRHAWLYSRNYWEQDPGNPSRNDQRNESIQVTENLLDNSTIGSYEHLRER